VLFRSAMFVLLLALIGQVHSLDNGVGLTPAMGYNTWNDFRCDGITDANIRLVANKIVQLGLNVAGYNYVNIDDCWASYRDNVTHRLVPDVKAFPNGMKAVADYVHSLGLKFGIYTDRGTLTCAQRPASFGFEKIDAQTFADWGVDYLKEDSCFASGDHTVAFAEYGAMRDALNATGRHIYFSLCGWSAWYSPPGWSLGNSWRIAGDCNEWDSIYNAIRVNANLWNNSRPGGWNDPDMLVGSSVNAAVHNTPDQARTQFSLWCVMAAPLLIGSNILNMSVWDFETYSNVELIAIDQDPLGVQGRVIVGNCPALTTVTRNGVESAVIPECQEVWGKPLSNGDAAVVLVNYGSQNATVTCDSTCLSSLGFTNVFVRDLWAHVDLGQQSSISVEIPGQGASASFRIARAPSQ